MKEYTHIYINIQRYNLCVVIKMNIVQIKKKKLNKWYLFKVQNKVDLTLAHYHACPDKNTYLS